MLLNHERLDTTQIYTKVAINDLKRLHTALHPAARMERAANRVQSLGAIPVAADRFNQRDEEDEEEGMGGIEHA